MTENDNDRQPEKHDQPQNDIPLWLQGLQEKPDDSSPVEKLPDTPEKAWVKEANLMDDITPPAGLPKLKTPSEESLDDTDEIPTVSGIIGNDDEDLPDWLSELSGVDPAVPETEGNPEKISSAPETNPPFPTTEDDTDEIKVEAQGLTSESDFIEISDIDLNNLPDISSGVDDEALSADEDLPEWLNEMVTVDPPSSPVHEAEPVADNTDLGAETSEDEEIPTGQIEPEVELEAQQHHMDESDTAENEPELKGDASLQEFELRALEDTSPVIISPADEEDDSPIFPISDDPPQHEGDIPEGMSDEMPEPEDFDSAGVPQTLRFAKVFLDQGEVVQALDILYPYIEKASYLNEIKRWLTDAAQSDTEAGCELWEALGDIAIYQDNSSEALDAYTKAIQNLLSQKDPHEPR